MRKHQSQSARHGKSHHVNGIDRHDEHDATEQRRRDVVEMTTRHLGFGHEATLEEHIRLEYATKQCVYRRSARNGGGGAAALAARQRKFLPHGKRDTRGAKHASLPQRLVQHRTSSNGCGMLRRRAWQIGMTGIEQRDTCRRAPFGNHLVARPGNGAPEHVEPWSEIADPSRCCSTIARMCLTISRAGHRGAVSRRTSPSTPAAVTSTPAPGPETTSGRSR